MDTVKQPDAPYRPTGTIVPKGGARATVTYVLDDGNEATARYILDTLARYRRLRVSFALPGKRLAELHTEKCGEKEVYVRDAQGAYMYTPNEASVSFWKTCLNTGRAEVIPHTYSHAFWGTDDVGGTYPYVSSFSGELLYATVPEGSTTKEIYAAQQIIADMFPEQKKQSALCMVEAGIGANTGAQTVNGILVPSYVPYYRARVLDGIKQGKLLGQRGCRKKINLPSALRTPEQRYDIGAYMLFAHDGTDGISHWTAFVDEAVQMGGWACFCIHKITPEPSTPHYILQTQAEALFSYTDSEDIWTATFTDALLYYTAWGSAALSLSFLDQTICVRISGMDNDIYSVPLTVRVDLPDSWDTARVGGTPLTVHRAADGKPFVYVDVVPDADGMTISR